MFGWRKRKQQSDLDDYTVEAMEPRVLLSADALGVDAGVLDPDSDDQFDWRPKDAEAWTASLANARQSADPDPDITESGPLSFDEGQTDGRIEIVFLDAGVEDGQQLLADLLSREGTAITQMHLLDADSDGIEQIAQVLAGQRGIDAVHIISHGAAGQIQLGSTTLSTDSLDGYAGQLNDWGGALADSGDILFYGCDFAADAQGGALVNAIGILTGADVAASVDQTGNAAQGGDWDLEYRAGPVEATVFAPVGLQTWQGLLAAFIVDTTADTPDETPGDGVAEDAAGNTSLRAAVMEANVLSGADSIYLGDETYSLVFGATSSDATGDLDIRDDLTIVGLSPTQTSISGGGIDRVIDVKSDASFTLTLSNLKIESGLTVGPSNHGAGISIEAGVFTPEVFLSNVWLTGNHQVAGGDGGAIHNEGILYIENSLIEDNSGTRGAGVFNAPGATLTMSNTTLSGNDSDAEGGGLYSDGNVTLRNVTVAENSSGTNGGGIYAAGGTLDIANSIVADNSAGGSGPDVQGTIANSVNNIIKDAAGITVTSGSFLNTDPMLGSLTDNGGELDSYSLLASSPAIDGADRALMPNTDQRGFLRGDGSPDIGAYEASSSAATSATYLDIFPAYSWSGDNGTLPWSNDWQEIGEADGAGFGSVSVWEKLGERGLYLWAADNVGAWRQADLSGATGAVLSFDWAMTNTELLDQAVLQVSTDGIIWNTLDTFDGPLNHSAMQSASYNISAYIDSDTRIRFETVSGFSANDVFFVDDVRIDLSTASPVTTTLSPIKDTYIDSANPSINYGSDTVIRMDEATGGLGDGRVLLQFDLSSIPSGATITSATLQVEASGKSGAAGDSSIINVYEVTEAWDEGAATWDERQALTAWGGDAGAADTTPPNPPSLKASGLGAQTWDITDLAQDWQTGTKINNGLMLASPDIGTVVFDYVSREGATPPQLVITYTTVPVPSNIAPIFTSFVGPATSGDEDNEITVTFDNLAVQGDETDADGSVDAFVVKSVTSGTLKIGAAAGTATAWAAGSNDTLDALSNAYWTPDSDANGTLNAFEVVAEDDDGAESATNVIVQVTVNPINDAPTATNLTSTSSYNEGDATVAITDIVVSDVDAGETVTATLTLADTGTGSLNALNGASYTPGTGVWTITDTVANVNTALANLVFSPVANNESDTTIDVVIDDNDEDGSGPLTGTITLDVTRANDAPVVVNPIPDQMATEDSAFGFQFASATFNDTDVGDVLTYSAQQVDGTPLPGWLAFDNATRTFFGTPLNADVGTLNIEVTATDSLGATVSDTFELSIGNVNDAPVIGNNWMTLGPGDTVTITTAMLEATDVDHAAGGLQFTISGVSGGQFELISAPGIGITEFTQAQVAAGEVVFVDDGDDVAPAYSVAVGDTVDSDGPHAATVVLNVTVDARSTVPVEPDPEPEPEAAPTFESPPEPEAVVVVPAPEATEAAPEPESDSDTAVASEEASHDETEEEVPVGPGEAPPMSTSTEGVSVGPATIPDFNSGSSAPDRGSIQGLLKGLFVRPAALAAMTAQYSVPDSFEANALSAQVRAVLVSTDFNSSLDRMRNDISDPTVFHQAVVGSSVAVTTGLSVGYVAWLVRGGVLLSTALSSLPAWQFIDPLPVLARTRDDGEGDGRDDSLQSIIKEESARAANKAKEANKESVTVRAAEPVE